MDRQSILLLTVGLLCVYVVGIGGTTAAAIGMTDRWRRRARSQPTPDLRAPVVVLDGPTLPRPLRVIRAFGWVAFPFALALGVFFNLTYAWVAPVTVAVMVALNAFHVTAMQGFGKRLTLTAEGFQVGDRTVRWIHVTDLTGAHLGAFRGARMSEAGEWQDPKLAPNVVLYRLNRALVTPDRSGLRRWMGLGYYDGVIRNAFGVATQQLLQAMRDRRRAALEAEGPPLGSRVKRP